MLIFLNALLTLVILGAIGLIITIWVLFKAKADLLIVVNGTLISLGITIAAVAGLLYVNGFHYVTGKGSHLGYISSTETNGIFFKTPRLYFKTSLRSSQEDKYCVANKKLYEKLGALVNENVEIQYTSYLANGIKNCQKEDSVVTGFKIIGK